VAASSQRQDDDDQDSEEESNVISMPGVEPGSGVAGTAAGGLTLRFAFEIPKLPPIMSLNTWTHQQLINGVVILLAVFIFGGMLWGKFFGGSSHPAAGAKDQVAAAPANIRPSLVSSFNPTAKTPVVATTAFVDPAALVVGGVSIGERAYVAPMAIIRGDKASPIAIGEGASVQAGAVIDGLPAYRNSRPDDEKTLAVGASRYAVFIGAGTTLASQSQVLGPVVIGERSFVGMQALVSNATIGNNVILEPGAKVIGVKVADNRYAAAGVTVTTQAAADALPKVDDAYRYSSWPGDWLRISEELVKLSRAALGPSAAGAHGEKPAASTAALEEKPAAPSGH
jgi:carbonic anhydrase/acetyltransferase-like protein (isoleucine patch superfamily)